MTEDSAAESSAARRVWSAAVGIGWLAVIAATIYLTRDLDPRSWLSRPDWFALPGLPWYLKLLGPVKIVLLVVGVGLAAAGVRGRKGPSQQLTDESDAPPEAGQR